MGRDEYSLAETPGENVSIRAPAWGAIHSIAVGRKEKLFQFARPHGARYQQRQDPRGQDQVSIRAPAWGAIYTRVVVGFA